MSQQNYLLNILKLASYPSENFKHLRCNYFYLHFATVLCLFPWLRPEGGKIIHMFLCFMKPDYHLELINNCICLYIGRGTGCSSLKMPKK